jgi:hypothetical protein
MSVVTGGKCNVSLFGKDIDFFDPGAIFTVFGGLADAISGKVAEGAALMNKITTALANPTDVFNSAKAALGKLVDRIILEAENLLETLIEKALEKLLEEFNKLMQALYEIFMAIKNLINAIIEGFIQGVCDVIEGVVNILKHFVDAIKAGIDTVTGPIFNIIDKVEAFNIQAAQDAAKREEKGSKPEEEKNVEMKYLTFKNGKLVVASKTININVDLGVHDKLGPFLGGTVNQNGN